MGKNFLRVDGTKTISTDSTDNPKLGSKLLKDGRESLYLDYYLGYHYDENGKIVKERKRESLKLYLHNSRNPVLKEEDRMTLDLAKQIRFEREQDLKEGSLGYRLESKKVNMIDYFTAYVEAYDKKDTRTMRAAMNYFRDFLMEYAPLYANNLPPAKFNEDMMEKFRDYLMRTHMGEGASTYFQRFKKAVKRAVKDKVLRENPCEGLTCVVDKNVIRKDILSMEEIAMMIETHVPGENPVTRRAFIFCLLTGLRWCDVNTITYGNVDFSNRLLKFDQNKESGRSTCSWVVIPLTDDMLELIGEGERGDLIFPLPSHTMALKALRHWVAAAGIDKHITWHCARHSFGTNILENGANIRVVQSLLGHSSTKYTERYTRAIDESKVRALNTMPRIHRNNDSDNTTPQSDGKE